MKTTMPDSSQWLICIHGVGAPPTSPSDWTAVDGPQTVSYYEDKYLLASDCRGSLNSSDMANLYTWACPTNF